MRLSVDREALKCIINASGTRVLAVYYAQFEQALFGFLKLKIEHERKCVWLPAIMQNKIVNINDMHLLVSDPHNTSKEQQTRFEFSYHDTPHFDEILSDMNSGSFELDFKDKPSSCNVSAAFSAVTQRSITLTTAASGLKECRRTLDEARRLVARPVVVTIGEESFYI